MSPMFYFLAGMTLLGAVASMSLRNPVHCALSLVVTFAGLAGIYLGMGAQFLGLAQVVVYIGAVAILLVFVLLLTRAAGGEGEAEAAPSWKMAVLVGVLVAGVMGAAVITAGRGVPRETGPEPVPVAEIGRVLMAEYALPLQVIGVVLTVAMIGAAVLAMPEKRVAAGKGVGVGGKEDGARSDGAPPRGASDRRREGSVSRESTGRPVA
jgi:NADH-quinone oxidoreductase subunit J